MVHGDTDMLTSQQGVSKLGMMSPGIGKSGMRDRSTEVARRSCSLIVLCESDACLESQTLDACHLSAQRPRPRCTVERDLAAPAGFPKVSAPRRFSRLVGIHCGIAVCLVAVASGSEPKQDLQYTSIDLQQLTRNAAVTAVSIADDGQRLAAGFSDGTAAVWDAKRQATSLVRRVANSAVSFVAFDLRESRRLIVAAGGALRSVSPNRESEDKLLVRASGDLVVQRSPDGTKLAIVSQGAASSVTVFDTKDGRIVKGVPLSKWPKKAAVDNTGTYVALAYEEAVVVLRTVDGVVESRFSIGNNQKEVTVRVAELSFGENASQLLAGFDEFEGLTSGLSIMDVRQGTLVKEIKSPLPDHFAVSPCGEWLAVPDPEGAYVYEVPSLRLRAKMLDASSRASPSCACISRNGQLVAIGGIDGHVRLWVLKGNSRRER